MEMTEKTQEFLLACKEAGYERVTIFIHDERVPCSVKIRKGSTGWDADEDGMVEIKEGVMRFVPKPNFPASFWGLGNPGTTPLKVVCGFPERLGPHPQYSGNTWPQMWSIVKELDLNQKGAGSGDGHDIRAELCHLLTAGYYDLSELN